ncbi:hypothetical protein BLNAU_13977 [Blattamonas nauphoetae]|uniref:Transposase Tc1-like domain-containing protein n=1 Tax=Blattamonas nauphoetae TaxID=2049346 RepID=A0ABQ9XI64_9EUKA|nr:hypothetical protein BLNAU_13977 [Blattamonas nauphoetae]
MVIGKSLKQQKEIRDTYREKQSIRKTAIACKCGTKTVQKYVDTIVIRHQSSTLRKKVKSKLISPSLIARAKSIVNLETIHTWTELKARLRYKGCLRHFICGLKAAGVKLKNHRYAPAFKEVHVTKRRTWAKEMVKQQMKTDPFLFDDEKSFRSVGARKLNRSLHDAKTPAKEMPSPVRPFTCGVWAAIGVDFKTDIVFKTTRKGIKNVKWRKPGITFRQCPTAQVESRDQRIESGSDRMYKGGRQYKTKEELKEAIEQTWKELDQETINRFCRSFGSRVGELISKDGQLTNY